MDSVMDVHRVFNKKFTLKKTFENDLGLRKSKLSHNNKKTLQPGPFLTD